MIVGGLLACALVTVTGCSSGGQQDADAAPASEAPSPATGKVTGKATGEPTDGPTDGATGEQGGGTVLQPGRPGEPVRTLGPDATVAQPRWNDADVRFLQMMIPHHAQALEMSRLARSRAEDESVDALARRIGGTQGPEIVAMSSWLDARGFEVPTAEDLERGDGRHGGRSHGHGAHGSAGTAGAAMPGMLTDAAMSRLAAAEGERFDRLFLQAMTRHHRGAVQMADRALTEGNDIRVGEIAADISVGQTAEIQRMRSLRAQL